MPTVRLPNNWRPRPDQMKLWADRLGCDVVAGRTGADAAAGSAGGVVSGVTGGGCQPRGSRDSRG